MPSAFLAVRQYQCSVTSWELGLNARSEPNKDSDGFFIAKNLSQLKSFLGFFAYNAKWITGYSNKVAPLLASQKQLAFPLNHASRLAIATLKKEVSSVVLWLPRAKNLSFYKPTHAESVSEPHSLRATSLSVSSREL